ncbi:fimbria/pilus periplasmic chaperone [Serratia proteamaculans]|jgi:P pilus assembly chaperone PapD|uniref:fimbria/pilus periplasmic chaperone n=1 Tax=Serratia proteamaculans TaxID=28151 RepID=UPI000D8752D2|nr:fimbria/pilus periplasmic chaperone [Serratia proteamaculans]SPZ57083.1 Chaperone protein papD precursor [Serratia quinivorans]CAI0974613.1 Chaperone protein papD precursor [Serratia proteamaculans]CAI1095628.1 Chaperone protein papD precursor [Serratia proteamaculans]CAI1130565.1 Chaperone protein papD precursor [Serratia proteamaculans]CAI1663849.1 Chaperone protein papD precursor [Serratia proteamaculans]
MKNTPIKTTVIAVALLGTTLSQQTLAAIALDRTRVIFDGSQNAVSLNLSNQNKQLPYLAQGWLEDAQGNKIQSPLVVLPPVQRIEPGKPSQIKVQALPAAKLLPQDRETLFYFNLREIPPRSEKPNTLQIALQTRIKLFYRPAAIMPSRTDMATPWQEQLTLTRQGDRYLVNNPTPYYITLIDAGSQKDTEGVKGFEPFMIVPKGQATLAVSAASLGSSPVLTYINDYGGRPQLTFNCNGGSCKVVPEKKKIS